MPEYRDKLAEEVKAVLARHPVKGLPMSRDVAARRTGISSGSVRNLMDGYIPSRDLLRKFADGLKERRVPLLKAAGYIPDEKDEAHDLEHFGPRAPSLTVALDNNPLAQNLRDLLSSEPERVFDFDGLPWPLTTEGARDMQEPTGRVFDYDVTDDRLKPGAENGETLRIKDTNVPVVGLVAIASIKEGEGTRLICERYEGSREEDGQTVHLFQKTEAPADILGVVLRILVTKASGGD